MKILVTGSAGFIGSALSLRLLEEGHGVVGLDNLDPYYDVELKEKRLERHLHHPRYTHLYLDLKDREAVMEALSTHRPERVVNLAAQAGVRYSLENPAAYVDTNLVGFANLLEACRHHPVDHLVFASSSSVYGGNRTLPFSVHHNVDHPLSLYAATKKANELMAHTYSHLYGLPVTGLRFFTVYGPWGRPDMALFKFTRSILAGEPIEVYGYGHHRRDFTYIDDIVEGVVRVIHRVPKPAGKEGDPSRSATAPYRIYNIGNHRPVELMEFIGILERCLGRKAEKRFLPMQPGDVEATYADIEDLERDVDFRPTTPVEVGIQRFVDWYLTFYVVGER